MLNGAMMMDSKHHSSFRSSWTGGVLYFNNLKSYAAPNIFLCIAIFESDI